MNNDKNQKFPLLARWENRLYGEWRLESCILELNAICGPADPNLRRFEKGTRNVIVGIGPHAVVNLTMRFDKRWLTVNNVAIERETMDEVKEAVVEWGQTQLGRVVEALAWEFEIDLEKIRG